MVTDGATADAVDVVTDGATADAVDVVTDAFTVIDEDFDIWDTDAEVWGLYYTWEIVDLGMLGVRMEVWLFSDNQVHNMSPKDVLLWWG